MYWRLTQIIITQAKIVCLIFQKSCRLISEYKREIYIHKAAIVHKLILKMNVFKAPALNCLIFKYSWYNKIKICLCA